MMVLSLWSAHFLGEEVRGLLFNLLQLEPEAVPVKKQVGSGVCSVLACGVRVLFASGGVAPLSAGTDGCPLWAQVHPLLPLPPRRNPSALACLPAVLRRRACLGGRKVAVQLSPSPARRSIPLSCTFPFTAPSCLGFLYCQWVQGGGTGAKEARSRVKQILCACWAAVQLSVTLNSSELVCAAMNDIIAA